MIKSGGRALDSYAYNLSFFCGHEFKNRKQNLNFEYNFRRKSFDFYFLLYFWHTKKVRK